jgi:hypothetical protein
MPYVLRTRPDLDSRSERRYGWMLFVLLLLVIGAGLLAGLILGD